MEEVTVGGLLNPICNPPITLRFNEARTVARRILRDERITEISTRSLLHNPRAFKATKAFVQISARLPQFRRREDAEGSLQ
ncbi:hypothetical protein PGT21_026632 [Puccinia graminis f. sp. tritici]|uniref:Uncharacterized protein n=1 Tax=Puccinia graminis f. sp. tritici TaxID=56615 RepID=A0A5B0RVU6_PUCGR|nr:hypothetical protein PGT21_026632 [Puccinia graminis f. sp. tritici]KAA1128973.1 hypothetical protein PGTUg99_016606 [Puccinia graminis f. sp. tritici]